VELKQATLLIVDDEPNLCEIILGWFEKEGSRVLSAENGFSALELLQKQEVNAIVTDIRMPGMDGTELVRRSKALGKYTPAAVSISGFSDITPREAYDLGIEAQLSKPVGRKALVSAVRNSLMDREQLWAEPFRPTTLPTLKVQFESFGSALKSRKILFGHGGFCIATKVFFPEASSIGFELDFAGEKQMVSLQGVVRWSAPGEQLAGVEITRVGDPSRSWVAELARSNRTGSFIPRSI
jgi:CheY-like chemotaxis protein